MSPTSLLWCPRSFWCSSESADIVGSVTCPSQGDSMPQPTTALWPELPYEAWRDTCATLQLWTQIVGKIRLTNTPWLNHSWHVALYVTARGLTTSPIAYAGRSFEMIFDFNSQELIIDVSDGSSRRVALKPRTVADFYAAVMSAL